MKLLLDTHTFLWLVVGSPLIAQALVEGMTLVSGDGKFASYPVTVLWQAQI